MNPARKLMLHGLRILIVLLVSMLPGLAFAQQHADMLRAMLGGSGELTIEAEQGAPPVGRLSRAGSPHFWYGNSYALIGSVGYSGKPVDILVVVDANAIIRAAKLLNQEEPILTIGVPPDALERYVAGFAGVDVRQPVRELVRDGSVPDGVSGATISSGVIRDAILRSGRIIFERIGAANGAAPPQPGQAASWSDLAASGKIATLTVSGNDARKAMPGIATLPGGDDIFVEASVAMLNDRATADALLGARRFDRLATEFAADDTILLIAARGSYSVKGTQWVRTGAFDRLELSAPGIAPFHPRGDGQHRLDRLHIEGAPEFREIMLLAVPAATGIRPDQPFTLTLIADKTAEGAAGPARFSLAINAGHPEPETAAGPTAIQEEPLWLENWRDALPQLIGLAFMLTVLFVALYISGPLVRRPKAYFWFRTAFLSVTLVWLGWIAGAQLSIVQLVAFLNSLIAGFNWQVFLLAPLIFVLWAFVALGILFWGRGVYCGWLCPFGALQELLHKAGQRLGVRRIEIPWEIHERLWPVKYVALLGIIALSLQDMALSFRAAEIEPFKTSITLHFLREWPFVLYAVALLAAGLLVERFYCRYLCPLGAALAFPAEFKIFDWLIRRPQCGRECRLCAVTCTVQAIDPIGRINPRECIYCLKCQVNYHDAETCVPLKMRARRREGAPGAAAGGP